MLQAGFGADNRFKKDMINMIYHAIAFLTGFILDLILGDPYIFPHPVRLIGRMISGLEITLYNEKKNNVFRGGILVVIVIILTMTVTAFILVAAYKIHVYAGMFAESVMTYQILAIKCLRVESMKVYYCLEKKDIEGAKEAVSMIVGRDTENLTEEEIVKAAVETVAENTSDGIIAPMIYAAAGGPVAAFIYKAVNTMDSMIGYKNERYLYFGRFAAKLDDVLNFIPARISAFLMIIASFIGGSSYSGKRAYRIYKRDNRKHASPNSAQTESVCAGALGIRLAGNASYFGKIVEKEWIGDSVKKVEYVDIKRTIILMYITAFLCEILSLLSMCTIYKYLV